MSKHQEFSCQLLEGVEETRGAVCERVDRKTGKTIWCARFTHPSAPPDHAKVLWLDGPPGGEWFSAEDHHWFELAVNLKRNVSVKFDKLHDAYAFLARLKGAEARR